MGIRLGAASGARRKRGLVAVCGALILSFTSQGVHGDVLADVFFEQVGIDIDDSRAAAISADGNRVAMIERAGEYPMSRVRILDWDGGSWTPVGHELSTEHATSAALSADGDRVAIGPPPVRIFDWDGVGWSQAGSALDVEDSWLGGRLLALSPNGNRVAIGGEIVSVGPARVYSQSAVQVFDWDGVGWSKAGAVIGGSLIHAGSFIGVRVAMSIEADRVAIGSESEWSSDVRVYDWDGVQWLQTGGTLTGVGSSVALSGSGQRLAVGAFGRWNDLGVGGAAWVLDLVDDDWVLVDEVVDLKVSSVSLSADGRRLAYSTANRADGEIIDFSPTIIRDEGTSGWSDVGEIRQDTVVDRAPEALLSAGGDRVALGPRIFDVTTTPPLPIRPVSLVPSRLLDTRLGNQTVDGVSEGIGRRAAGSVTVLRVAGRGGVPERVPAVILNVAAVQPDGPGYLTVYACSAIARTASSLNYATGDVISNLVFAQLGVVYSSTGTEDGTVCIYTHAATDLVVDVTGFTPARSDLWSLAPARLLETRPGNETVDGVSEGIGRRAAGSVTEVVVGGRTAIGWRGVPVGATSATLNVAAVLPDGAGHLTVYPCGVTRPLASSLNYAAGDVISNSVFTHVGEGGKVCIYTHAATDLVADVTGYTPVQAGLTSLVPSRLLDTRAGSDTVDGISEGIGRQSAGSVAELNVVGRGGLPVEASAVLLNVAAVLPDGAGHLTVYPCGVTRPLASSLNYAAGDVISNSVFTQVGEGGKVCIYTHAATDLVADVTGYT